MGVEQVKQHLAKYQLSESIITLDESSASVEEAAKALHIQPEQVAKSLTFSSEEGCIMVLLAGDRKVHNGKFKRTFHTKPHMLSSDQVLAYTNHEVGGVCPFGVNDHVFVYLDRTLQDYDFVYPACGERNNAIKLTPQQLFEISQAIDWVDVAKDQ